MPEIRGWGGFNACYLTPATGCCWCWCCYPWFRVMARRCSTRRRRVTYLPSDFLTFWLFSLVHGKPWSEKVEVCCGDCLHGSAVSVRGLTGQHLNVHWQRNAQNRFLHTPISVNFMMHRHRFTWWTAKGVEYQYSYWPLINRYLNAHEIVGEMSSHTSSTKLYSRPIPQDSAPVYVPDLQIFGLFSVLV